MLMNVPMISISNSCLRNIGCGLMLGILPGLSSTALATPFDDQISSAGTQQWVSLPNTRMETVQPNPVPTGTGGVINVMIKWNGAAYDTSRDRLVVWGGGHWDYAGNEVYTFDVNSMQWELFTQPTPNSQIRPNVTVYPDGTPGARHTYDELAYIPPPIDRFYARGDALYGEAWSDNTTWLFDFNSRTWTAGATKNDYVPNEITDYDFVTNKVYSHGKNYLSAYDPTTNSWATVSQSSSYQQLDGNGAIDPIRRKFVRIGAGLAHVWDLDNPSTPRSNLNTTGATQIVNSYAPGFVYDPVSDKFVAWDGLDSSGALYVLDMDTLVWTRIVPQTPVRPNIIASREAYGTFGRFQYIPSKNVFLGVNYTDDNVYIFKLNASPPMSVPAAPAQPSVTVN